MRGELQQFRHGEHDVEVSGDVLVARSPLLLPATRCVKCGSTEPGGAIHNRVINYVNPIVWLTFLISGLITVIAYLATRKRMQLQYYLCPKCEDKRRTAHVTTNLVSIVSVAGMALTLTGGPFEVFLGGLAVAMLARIFWVREPLHATGHDDGRFALKGAAPQFLGSVERKQLEG